MQRGLLHQLAPGDTRSLDELVEEVQLAEQLGIDAFWCLPGAGEAGDFRLGAVELWLAALAGRTERIRLGWALPGLTPPDRPPIRIAEKAAFLDQASAGRLDLAILPDQGREGLAAPRWDEGVRMLVAMWDQPQFSWTSPRFDVPPVDVLPKPVQRPHPPVWLVGWSLEHAMRAGIGGLGLFDVSGAEDEILEMHREAYLDSRREADPNDLASVSAFAVALDLPSGDETGEARDDGELAERLARFDALGFDQAVLRIAPLEGGHEGTKARIRLLAQAAGEELG